MTRDVVRPEAATDEFLAIDAATHEPLTGVRVRTAVNFEALLSTEEGDVWEGVVDARGVATIDSAEVGTAPRFWGLAQRDGYAVREFRVDRTPGEGSRTTLRLFPLIEHRITVTRPSGLPVAGAEICCTAPLAIEALRIAGSAHPLVATLRPVATSLEDGSATLQLDPTRVYRVGVTAAGCAGHYANEIPAEEWAARQSHVVLCAIVVVGIELFDRGSKSASERSIAPSPYVEWGSEFTAYHPGRGEPSASLLGAAIEERIGRRGVRFEFGRERRFGAAGSPPKVVGPLDPGEPPISVPAACKPIAEFSSADVVAIRSRWSADELASVRIRFVDSAGASCKPATPWSLAASVRALGIRPAAEGEAFAFVVPPGVYVLKNDEPAFHGRSFDDVELQLDVGTTRSIDVPLTNRSASIEATACDETGRRLIDWQMIALPAVDGAMLDQGRVDDDAPRTFPSLPAGRITIVATAPGHLDQRMELELAAGEHRRIEFTIKASTEQ